MRIFALVLMLTVVSAAALLFGLALVWAYRLLRGRALRPPSLPADQVGAPPTIGVPRGQAWLWPMGGLAVGAVGAVWAAQVDVLGRGWLVAATVLGAGIVGALVLAEVVVRGPQGRRRSATLVPRRGLDYVPRPLGGAVLAVGCGLVVVLGMTTKLGSPDDMSRSGRSLARTCGLMSAAIGPWPGSFYTAPIAVSVVLTLALAGLGLRVIASRPPASGDRSASMDAAADEASRRRAGRAVTAAVGIAVSTPLVLVAVAAGVCLRSIVCAASWWDAAGLVLYVLAFAASGVLGWCVVTLLGFRRTPPSPLPQAASVTRR